MARPAAINLSCSSKRFIGLHSIQTFRSASRLQILVFGQSGQTLFHFRPGSKSANFDQRHGPAGQIRDFLDRPVFNFQQGDDQPGSGRKLLENALNELPRRRRALASFLRMTDESIQPILLWLSEFWKRPFRGFADGREGSRSKYARSNASANAQTARRRESCPIFGMI